MKRRLAVAAPQIVRSSPSVGGSSSCAALGSIDRAVAIRVPRSPPSPTNGTTLSPTATTRSPHRAPTARGLHHEAKGEAARTPRLPAAQLRGRTSTHCPRPTDCRFDAAPWPRPTQRKSNESRYPEHRNFKGERAPSARTRPTADLQLPAPEHRNLPAVGEAFRARSLGLRGPCPPLRRSPTIWNMSAQDTASASRRPVLLKSGRTRRRRSLPQQHGSSTAGESLRLSKPLPEFEPRP